MTEPSSSLGVAAVPEGREQLAAFREIANQSARNALNLHDRRDLATRAQTMFLLALGTLLLAGALATLAKLGYPRTANSALVVCGLAMLPASFGLLHTVRLQWQARARRRFADKSAT